MGPGIVPRPCSPEPRIPSWDLRRPGRDTLGTTQLNTQTIFNSAIGHTFPLNLELSVTPLFLRKEQGEWGGILHSTL